MATTLRVRRLVIGVATGMAVALSLLGWVPGTWVPSRSGSRSSARS